MNICLSPNALFRCFRNQIDNAIVWGKLKQHTIIFSDIIYDKYLELIDPEEKETFQIWFATMCGYRWVKRENSIGDSFENEIRSQLLNSNSIGAYLIYDSSDSIGWVNEETLSLVNDESETSLIVRYSPTADFFFRAGDNITDFTNWLKNVLSGAHDVKIIDRFICKQNKQWVYQTVYHPLVPSSATVSIYYSDDVHEYSQAVVSALQGIDARITMNKSQRSSFHNRFIVFNDGNPYYIGIQRGLDFVGNTGQTISEETNITYNKGNGPTLPIVIS